MDGDAENLANGSWDLQQIWQVLLDIGSKMWQFVLDNLPVAVAGAAVYIAWRGLTTWQRQVRDKITVERAVSFLDSAFDYAQSVTLMMVLADN